jgi:hypothetical protein
MRISFSDAREQKSFGLRVCDVCICTNICISMSAEHELKHAHTYIVEHICSASIACLLGPLCAYIYSTLQVMDNKSPGHDMPEAWSIETQKPCCMIDAYTHRNLTRGSAA